MYKRKISLQMNCGFELIRHTLTGKWKLMILYCLYENINRPSAINKAIPDLSRRVINIQLNQLMAYNLVEKKDFQEKPLKVEYYLSPLGKRLMPLLIAIGEWAEDNKETLQDAIHDNVEYLS